ncbi:MAG: hypothetical protein WC334_07880, partial [Kiritimatiellales bacterium]
MKKQRFITRYLFLSVALLSAGLPAVSQAAADLNLVPGVVLYYSPSPAINYFGKYTSDPEIAVLSNGWYIASHTTFNQYISSYGDPGVVHIYRSTDKGTNWSSIATLSGLSAGGSFFYNNGALFLMGGSNIIQSTDNGTIWTTPADTNSGVFAAHSSTWTPNNPILYSNRIWSAATTQAQSAPADSNLLAEASWKWSSGIANNTNWFDGQFTQMTEAQIVASPELGVVVMPKVRALPYTALIKAYSATNIPNSIGTTTFDPVNNFAALPGGEKKFGAAYDPVSKKFYVLSNPVLPAHANDPNWGGTPEMIRNTAAVLTSRDLFNWKVEKIFLYTANIDYEAFQYFNFDYDGPDMVIASRTAFDVGDTYKPPRGHDCNLITFHRINDFRNIAPDHYLTISGNQILRYERTPDPKDDDAPLGSFTLGSTFAGAALTSPNGMGQTAARDVYIRETGGRILHFDAAGNFIETNSSAPVSFQSSALTVSQPANGECSWADSGSGDWFEPLSWYYWGRPDTTEEIAVFGSAATAAATVNIPSATQIWDFNTDGDKEGWSVAASSNSVATNGVLQGTANTNTAGITISRTDRFFYGSTVPEIRLRLKADANCTVNFYWGTPQQDTFAAGARKMTQTYTNNGAFQDFVFPLAGNTNWDGQAITRIRFDPLVQTNAVGSRGFSIDSITMPRESYQLKGLRFRNPFPYTLSGGGQLRIEAGSGSGSIEVLQGKHTNNVELVLGSDTDMTLTNGTSLHLQKGIDLNGRILHVTGSGKLLMQDSLVMSGGTLVISGATPLTFTNNSNGAVLDGTLQFLPAGTFAPTNGTSFDLLDNPSVLGTKRFTTVSLPALSAGQQWNTNALYSTGSVSVEAAPYSLIVATAYGKASPAAGTNTYNYGTNLTAALTNSPVLNGTTTQYICRGWSGTGSVPVSGTSTNTGSFTLTNNSTVIWLWTTNYWLDTATNGNGSVNISDGWKTNGTSVQITASPGTDWLFTAWSGNTNGCTINGNIITAPMTSARDVTANFEVDPLSLPNTWQVDASGTWTNPVNWTDGIVPGISGGSNSADIVIFAATLTTNRIVTVDANRNIGGIIFANAANVMQPVPQTTTNPATSVGYTLNSGSIKLSNGGMIQVTNESGTNTSTISSSITIMGNGGSAVFRNDAAGGKAGLVIGAVSG